MNRNQEESDRAQKAMEEFCRAVEEINPNATGICGIDSPDWDTSLSRGYGIDSYEEVNEIVANILDALSIEYGWGPEELFEFMEKAIRKMSDSMRMRMPQVGLPPS